MTCDLKFGDCLDVMRTLPDASVDAVVTDPPAGISFMGKEWDGHKGGRAAWCGWMMERLAEARRVAKPGAYALVWALPRTSHWTACAVEDAGWRIVDRLAHVFGTGFPKHRSKLKPAVEDWWLAWNPDKKATPLPGLDDCRIDSGRWPTNLVLSHSPDCNGECVPGCPVGQMGEPARFFYCAKASRKERNEGLDGMPESRDVYRLGGRDGSYAVRTHQPDPRAIADYLRTWREKRNLSRSKIDGLLGTNTLYSWFEGRKSGVELPTPDMWLRLKSILGFDDLHDLEMTQVELVEKSPFDDRPAPRGANVHPTVKPIALMSWLVTLITPPSGLVLDPFMGSGSTGVACVQNGFKFLGIEQDPEYLEIARRRIENSAKKGEELPLFD